MTPELENKLHKILQCAKPINLMVYANTVLFLAMLPSDILEPELELEPNGLLVMVWRNNDYFKGYVMLKTNDKPNMSVHMLYAKPENLDVSFHSFEDRIPEEILTAIREIMKK